MNIPPIYDGVTVFASESECLSDAPELYRILMHSLHFLTLPLYILAIYALIYKSPDFLREYRKYLLWHTLGSVVFELYISIFMLPVTYLPLLVFRGTGILKYWNISGILQFWLLVATIAHTGVSVMEMFKYRYNVTMTEDIFNKRLLHKIVLFFWVIAIFISVAGLCLTPDGIRVQHKYKQNLWKASPGASIEIVCYNSVGAPPLSGPVFPIIMVFFIIISITACVIIPHTTFTMLAELEQLAKKVSKKTIEQQKMLLVSLFIQAAIHFVMLGAPIAAFIYGVYFSFDDNDLAYFLLLLISFHGSISTFAMVGFTKPIRIGVFQIIDNTFFHMSCRKLFVKDSARRHEPATFSRNSVKVYQIGTQRVLF